MSSIGTFQQGVFVGQEEQQQTTGGNTSRDHVHHANNTTTTMGTFEDGKFVVVAADDTKPRHYNLNEIWMRDPFVLPPIKPGEEFLLFGTTDKPPKGTDPYSCFPATGFDVYSATSMDGPWFGPLRAFTAPVGFWADTQFWAPEVVRYLNSYFIIASFRGTTTRNRCVQILKSTTGNGKGPYQVWSSILTPPTWFCLDGHLYLGEMFPFLVFAREWIEVGDGEMYCVQLSPDLTCATNEPILLFHASQAPWVQSIGQDMNGVQQYVTDGPFLWRARGSRELIMLWSSIGSGSRYQIGIARSKSGKLLGPWTHDLEPLFEHDGGHGMCFRINQPCALWNGDGPPPLVLALHVPNKDVQQSHALFLVLKEDVVNERLNLKVM